MLYPLEDDAIEIPDVYEPVDILKHIRVAEQNGKSALVFFPPPGRSHSNEPSASATQAMRGQPSLGSALPDLALEYALPPMFAAQLLSPAVCALSDKLCQSWAIGWAILHNRARIPRETWVLGAKELLKISLETIEADAASWPEVNRNRLYALAGLVMEVDSDSALPRELATSSSRPESMTESPERPLNPERRETQRETPVCGGRVADADADMRHLRAAVRQT
ncbi:hypothetical protein AURDEDRAFT_161034 [Auricularia subglabra TFB-10046 SS5]|nr:hypothetical protein AURDEDRAFT_161034 [Auricularia subglabra TFB-10046 SS5]